MARRSYSARRGATRVPLLRLMVVTVAMFWVLALFVFVVSQWVAPAFYSSTPSPTSGFDYGRSFGLPFIKTWGLWVAGALVVLGPFAAVWKALERGGDALMGKALGTGGQTTKRR